MDLQPRILENAFVRLEPMQAHHREQLRPVADDEDIWSLMTLPGFGPHFDAWFDMMLEAQSRDQISHVVHRKSDGKTVGHSSYLAIVPAQQRVEIGWTFYAAEARRTAVNPACKLLLIGNAFKSGALRVEFKTGGRNLRSQGAMTKMGFVREGIWRSHLNTWRGERRDTVYFSVLPEEWPSVKSGLEARLTAFSDAAA
ncbi:MAG: GNAT family N-acetyltransferase [Maricaulis sp.]|jgi:RimJ/RimL family protein N-acetyltransferase|nr:GNAT family N-acetyltransferase [Maricaulis sp.]|tara:strand:+ start:147 stop:740 length:594 start_codon:yes stop_codon:yes gene_type:complete